MKNAMKKLLSLVLVAMLLLSAVPFQAFATEAGQEDAATVAADEPAAQAEDAPEENGQPANTSEDNGQPANTSEENGQTANTSEDDTESQQNDQEDVTPPDGESVDDVVGQTVYVYFHVSFKGNDLKISGTKTKVGGNFPGFPSADTVKAKSASLSPSGSSAGMGMVGWYWDEGCNEAVTTKPSKVSTDIFNYAAPDDDHEDASAIHVYAKMEYVPVTISLDAKGGKFLPGEGKIQVTIEGEYPELPVPTRGGYTFVDWYVKDGASAERKIVAGDPVFSTAAPYAKWTSVPYTVSVKWYYNFEDGTAEDWDYFDDAKYRDMSIPSGSTLSASNGSFPTSSEINWKDLPSGYTLKGWKFLETGSDFTPGSTKITAANANSANEVIIVPKLQRKITLVANHPENITGKNYYYDSGFVVEIGKRIGELPSVGPCYSNNDSTTYTFKGWYSDDDGQPGSIEISSRANLKKTSEHPKYYPELGNRFQADWDESQVVMLYFHTGTTAKVGGVPCYEIPTSGEFDLSNLNLYKYFSNYGKYDDGVDVRTGWFTASQWANYCAGKPASKINTVNLTDADDVRDYQELHILLIDKGTDPNTYNNNNSTADKTNPKTGDMIITTVVIMGVSAAALAAAYYVNKKRSAC